MVFKNERSNLPSLTPSCLLIVAKVNLAEDPGVVDVVGNLLPSGVMERHTRSCRAGQSDLKAVLTINALKNSASGASSTRVRRRVARKCSGYADVALRDAINAGLVPGPRMQVATRAIAAIGQYEPFQTMTVQWSVITYAAL